MRVAGLLVLLLAFLAACTTTVPAVVTYGPAVPMDEAPLVRVSANEQLPRIEQSLRDAGLMVASRGADANYDLLVKVGGNRASKPCGPTTNIVYDLTIGGARVLVIKGRGFTGTCQPNIFDDMSRMLETYFGDGR